MNFEDISLSELINADFRLYPGNPVIRHPRTSPMIADPSIIWGDDSPDGLMHLFAHDAWGICQYVSADGINFKRAGQVVPDGMRPDVRFYEGRYFIYYEHLQKLWGRVKGTLGGKWESCIYCCTSPDLKSFSAPYPVLTQDRENERVREIGYSISNPFLIKIGDKYRMYYSCGLTEIPQCKFTEPTYICIAESSRPDSGFKKYPEPILAPDKSSRFFNLSCGCIKVYKLKDGYAAFQNGLYNDKGVDKSAIQLLKSDDGVHFEFVKTVLEPQLCGNNKWMAQFVYASHLIKFKGKLRLYFNARDTAFILTGREHIGFAEAEI